ncbi:MAG: hypothetical protein ACD_2C00189G0021, partial [uncultured bacterium (gcode 4)]
MYLFDIKVYSQKIKFLNQISQNYSLSLLLMMILTIIANEVWQPACRQ